MAALQSFAEEQLRIPHGANGLRPGQPSPAEETFPALFHDKVLMD